MARDPMPVLRRFRRITVERKALNVAACLRVEESIVGRIRDLDAEAQRERDSHGDMPERAHFLEIFANRAAQRRALLLALHADLAAAAARTSEARRQLSEARLAEEVVATLIEERRERAAVLAEAGAQHTLDDIARGMGTRPKR